ncbi:unnamed protein product [Pieris macdunnoughi]|uniref:Uncharacterized protein n=1 Tax=Pieris macdunnoughi TaxID=345717 RepID=A0A821XNY4_9NEOP|nr:unnamed protein product [Pieris macdunnoughi]
MKVQKKQNLPQGVPHALAVETPLWASTTGTLSTRWWTPRLPFVFWGGNSALYKNSNRPRGKRSNYTKAPPSTLAVDFTNVRGLNSNINAVHYHLETAKPALLFLTETQISSPADTSHLSYPGYKLEHSFVPRAGVGVYVREDICSRRLVDA